MTLEEAKQRKIQLEEELRQIIKVISTEIKKEKLSQLEIGKYYKYKTNECSTTYFQYTEDCKYNESEICGDTLSISRYIEVESTRMYYTTSFGNHGLLFINDFCFFEEITEEEYKNIFKRAIEYCNNELK